MDYDDGNRMLLSLGPKRSDWRLFCGAWSGMNDLMLERYNGRYDRYERKRVPIRYCPFCGAKLNV